ncbi:MAG: hypothetical protein ACLFV7_01060 [Phycisphaerae bacterium]
MLGRTRRTTRLDVGLALVFAGASYLVWALVAGSTRIMVQELIDSYVRNGWQVSRITTWVRYIFVDAGVALDVVGLVWLAGSLTLVFLASRQKLSISWAWVVSFLQMTAASIGSVLVGLDVHQQYNRMMPGSNVEVTRTALQKVSSVSLGVSVPLAVLLWATVLVYLLVERARWTRRQGPTLRDGLRTNAYK